MANEITGNIQFRCVNGSFDTGQQSRSLSITQNTQGAAQGVMIVPTTGISISVGTVTTYGLLFMVNLDSSISVLYGSSNSYEWTMKAGEPALLRMTPGASPAIKSASGSPKVQYILLQD